MHRSATSLIANLVSELGFAAAGELLPARASNPLGFWEHRELARCHEEFLGRLGHSWSYPGPIPPDAFVGADADEARRQIRRVIEADLLPLELWMVKDPRLCRLLPLWLPLLRQPRLAVRYLLVVRSPEEIAASLNRRDGLRRERSLMLWLRHVLEAEKATRGEPRFWLDLERFVAEPGRTIIELAAWLHADRRVDLSRATEVLEAVYDPSLLHPGSIAPDSPESPGFPWVGEVVAALKPLSGNGIESAACHRSLDRISAELERWDRLMAAGAADALLVEERDDARRQRDRLADRNAALSTTLEQIRASRSWRWTGPLRAAISWLRRPGGDR